jgi:putative oxidoreductase
MTLLTAMLCALVGGVFFASALPKLRHPKGFVLTVVEYRVLPYSLSRLYGRVVPPLEALVALLLIGGVAMRAAALVAALLLASYIIAVGVNVARGRDLDCHCFGETARRTVGWGLLAQDAAFFAASIGIAMLAAGWLAPESWSAFRMGQLESGRSGWSGIVSVMSGLGLAACGLLLFRAVMPGARRRLRGATRTLTRRLDDRGDRIALITWRRH